MSRNCVAVASGGVQVGGPGARRRRVEACKWLPLRRAPALRWAATATPLRASLESLETWLEPLGDLTRAWRPGASLLETWRAWRLGSSLETWRASTWREPFGDLASLETWLEPGDLAQAWRPGEPPPGARAVRVSPNNGIGFQFSNFSTLIPQAAECALCTATPRPIRSKHSTKIAT